MSKTVTPAEFDFDAWLSGASRPTRSVNVYQRGDLLAEADALAAKIEAAELVERGDQESSIADHSDADAMREQYAELAEEYYESALTLKFRALDRDEWAEVLRAAVQDDEVSTDDHRELSLRTIAAALVSPPLSVDQLRSLRDVAGDVQFDRVVEKYNELKSGSVEPSADFLPKPSIAAEDES